MTRGYRVGILPKRLASHVVKRKRQMLHLNGGHEVDRRPRRMAVCGGRLSCGTSITPSSCVGRLGFKVAACLNQCLNCSQCVAAWWSLFLLRGRCEGFL